MRTRGMLCVVVFIPLVLLALTNVADGAKPETGNYRVGKNVVLAAQEIIPEGLMVAGANVQVLGGVKDGLKAFGANVELPGTVEGDTLFAGANVVLSGNYHGRVKGGAANLVLSGTFDDNVEVWAAKITITPTAVIKKDLIYSSPVLDQSKGSQIMGKLTRKGMEVRKREIQAWEEGWRQRSRRLLVFLGILWWIVSLPALIIVGLLLHSFLPRQTEAVVSTISDSPWKNLGVGLVFLVVVPVGVILCLVTLVGIPTGIIAGLLYGIAIYISRIYMGVWVGRKLLGYVKPSWSALFFWPLVVGIILISLIGLIPFVGWLFKLFVVLISLGALWVVNWNSIRKARGGGASVLPLDAT